MEKDVGEKKEIKEGKKEIKIEEDKLSFLFEVKTSKGHSLPSYLI